MLNQSDVSGNQLGDVLIISPTIYFGFPEAIVYWSHDGQILDPADPRVNISYEGIITVTDVQASDRGIYTVTAFNNATLEEVMASVIVSINCK
jgi:hypothetical protein